VLVVVLFLLLFRIECKWATYKVFGQCAALLYLTGCFDLTKKAINVRFPMLLTLDV
jgi:hypothetical protein